VPEAVVVPVAVAGSTDIPRFPRRPRLRVEFLAPMAIAAGESPGDFAVRVNAATRAIAPITAAGRKPKVAAAPPAG
jgi:1-acyl-sn-glycerol-3-phosphate acyltransferase